MSSRTFFFIIGVSIVAAIVLYSSFLPSRNQLGQEQKQENEQVFQPEQPRIPQISIDSLSSLGINVTLWTESKTSFEKLNGVKADRVSLSKHLFIASTSGLEGEFDWSVAKQHMKWQGNKTELFTNYGKNFVVFGNYVTSQDKLIFSGYLYRYGSNRCSPNY